MFFCLAERGYYSPGGKKFSREWNYCALAQYIAKMLHVSPVTVDFNSKVENGFWGTVAKSMGFADTVARRDMLSLIWRTNRGQIKVYSIHFLDRDLKTVASLFYCMLKTFKSHCTKDLGYGYMLYGGLGGGQF